MDKSIQTVTGVRAVEAFLEIVVRILGLILVFCIFKAIGKYFVEDFSEDILLSVVILPSIYVLKDIFTVIEPYTVRVKSDDLYFEVQRGFATQKKDRLLLRNIDNVEVTRTLLGRHFQFCTINLYSAGGFLQIPFVKDGCANQLIARVEKEIEQGRSMKSCA